MAQTVIRLEGIAPDRSIGRLYDRVGETWVRSASAADAVHIDAVVAAAFGAHADVAVPLVHELRRTGAAALELVAVTDGEIVGHVLLSRGWVDATPRTVEVQVLSPLSVAPHRQREGIGLALIESVVAASEQAGVPAIFLEGDPAFYSRSGFVPASPEGFRSPSWRIPEAGFQVRLLRAHEPKMTGPLVYPDAFWSLGAIGPEPGE